MSEEKQKFGLGDAELRVRRTVYASDGLAGRVVLASGGAGGIGRAVCWLAARLGAHVIATGRKQDKLETLRAALADAGLSVDCRTTDVRATDAVKQLMDGVWERHGRLDLLVNSAGGQFPMAALDVSEKGWKAVVDTNLNGTWNMMQAAGRRWRDGAQPGSIVNVVVVTQGLYGIAHSVAARAGVIGLSRNLAVEWAQHGIRVNCVAPGAIETEGWNVYTPEVRATYADTNPMRSVGDTWDVAESIVYLGGPSGRYVTGEVLHVAGGSQLWGETWTIPQPAYFRS